MFDVKSETETKAAGPVDTTRTNVTDLPLWETPKLEDVSKQVMAQPYIRFT
jgi:hypothetical protein